MEGGNNMALPPFSFQQQLDPNLLAQIVEAGKNSGWGPVIQQAISGAEAAAASPFSMPVAPVAQLTQDQLQSYQNVNNAQGFASPLFAQAAGAYSNAAAPINTNDSLAFKLLPISSPMATRPCSTKVIGAIDLFFDLNNGISAAKKGSAFWLMAVADKPSTTTMAIS